MPGAYPCAVSYLELARLQGAHHLSNDPLQLVDEIIGKHGAFVLHDGFKVVLQGARELQVGNLGTSEPFAVPVF